MLTTKKPLLDPVKFITTQIYKWYQNIEGLNVAIVQSKLQFNQTNSDRKTELINLLNSANHAQQKQFLYQKIARYQVVFDEIEKNKKLFSPSAIEAIVNAKQDYLNKYNAYILSQQNIKGDYPISVYLRGVKNKAF